MRRFFVTKVTFRRDDMRLHIITFRSALALFAISGAVLLLRERPALAIKCLLSVYVDSVSVDIRCCL